MIDIIIFYLYIAVCTFIARVMYGPAALFSPFGAEFSYIMQHHVAHCSVTGKEWGESRSLSGSHDISGSPCPQQHHIFNIFFPDVQICGHVQL